MAGCKPTYLPVIVAAIEAISDARYNYHGPATSTGGSAVFLVVNGPIARHLDGNSGDNLFGPGWRAVAFWPELPKNPTGKVLRRIIRERMWGERRI
jgi:acyl-CoA synthetase (AMP-forming)/AMP-acid ligase II